MKGAVTLSGTFRICERIAPVAVLILLALCAGCTNVKYRVSAAPPAYRGLLWRFRSPSFGVHTARFSPDGRYILVRGSYACRVLETDSGSVVSVFENKREILRPLDCIVSIPAVIGLTLLGPIRTPRGPIDDSPTGPRPPVKIRPSPERALLTWAGDSRRAFYIDITRRLQTRDVETGRRVAEDREVALDRQRHVLAISPDGEVLVIRTNHRKTVELRCECRGWTREYPRPARIAFAAYKPVMAISQSDGDVDLIDCRTGARTASFESKPTRQVRLSDDAAFLLMDHADRTTLVDTATGRVLSEIKPPDLGLGVFCGWSSRNRQAVYCSISPSEDERPPHEAVIVDLMTGQLTHRAKLAVGEVVTGLSPDGRLILARRWNSHVSLYKIDD